jgi:hypothetical protein
MVKKKPPKQQSPTKWLKRALRRPVTLRVAMFAMNVVSLVARVYDWFR